MGFKSKGGDHLNKAELGKIAVGAIQTSLTRQERATVSISLNPGLTKSPMTSSGNNDSHPVTRSVTLTS